MTTTTPPLRSVIASANERFMTAFARRDSAAIAELYSSDAVLLPPNAPQFQGAESIRAFWDRLFTMGIDAVRLETLDLSAHDDIAVETGRATVLGSGGAVIDEGKYLVVWKNEGGSWKLHRDIWNSSRASS